MLFSLLSFRIAKILATSNQLLSRDSSSTLRRSWGPHSKQLRKENYDFSPTYLSRASHPGVSFLRVSSPRSRNRSTDCQPQGWSKVHCNTECSQVLHHRGGKGRSHQGSFRHPRSFRSSLRRVLSLAHTR